MFTLGNTNLLKTKSVALFCSVKCPGELIMKTYDLCLQWRRERRAVISGFHSPMEKECLRILLQAPQPVIVSPARGLWRRIPVDLRRHLDLGRLLIVTPFPESVKRITKETSVERNRFIGELADEVFVSYAEPRGKMEALCCEWIEVGREVLTFESQYTENLLELGAVPIVEGGMDDA